MSVKSLLQGCPLLFDSAMKVARFLGRQSALYRAINAIPPTHRPFTFLQVGANDGITCDPFREFMIRRNATGVTAEPVAEYWNKLKRNYAAYPRVFCLHAAVGYPAAENRFYAYNAAYVAKRGGWWELTGLAGFSRAKLERSLLPGDDPDQCIDETVVPTLTVEDILTSKGFESFDCLFMDCEGHEENILTNLDYDRVRPKMIVFEHTHFPESAQELIQQLGGRGFVSQQLEQDTVAVHRDWAERSDSR
jgi:FkbM family methyltransferase